MSKEKSYRLMNAQLEAILTGETNVIANLSNAAALLYTSMPSINWAGFYFYDVEADNLALGPFQGKVACVRIPIGKGVCGTAYETNQTHVVKDVNRFAGHIACDSASQSEIVVPFQISETLKGVLDIDAPVTERFDDIDRQYLEEFVQILVQHTGDRKNS
ncbi:GAF domain-containing protein [Pisciglobus halotolerans]|uniref:GAF domain-containing protein n=1 Tax=Pisciglobus halotolerans TaxID=745365 RepID=A0A1I3BVJ4_9LACT|nr:GAF domain-containing protein [Pisciglobus halotolerans]SFH66348.1 GAF domain-containing protein [Pisciglobus halotolerans]